MIINTDRLFRLYGEIFPIPSITVNVVPLLNPCHEYHHSKHLSAPLICYTSIIPPRSFNHIESSTDTFLFKTNIVRETSGTFLKSLSHIVKAVGTSSVSTGCNKGSSISFISGSHLSCHAEAGAFIVDAVNLPLQLTHRIASLNARHFI